MLVGLVKTRREWIATSTWEHYVLEFLVYIICWLVFKECHYKFKDDATDGPHVNWLVIFWEKKRNFWSSVPSGTYMWGQLPLIFIHEFRINFLHNFIWNFISELLFRIELLNPSFLKDIISNSFRIARSLLDEAFRQRSSLPKITDLYLTVFVDENILRFKITMDDVGRMQELHGTKKIVSNYFDVLERHFGYQVMLEDAPQITWLQVHH